jgi:hypothetical protein
MYRIGSTLLAAALFGGFAHYLFKVKVSKHLAFQSIVFAVMSHFVMHVYHQHFGYEHMTTFGDKCPTGYIMVDDPVNPQQQTCIANPSGNLNVPSSTGFQSEKK